MPHEDRYGLPLTTASDTAATHYRDGYDRMLAAWPGAAEAFERAIAADPRFALAHIARARVHQMYAEGEAARAAAAEARALGTSASERERSHIETLAASIDGQPVRALELALAHAARWPRDAMVLSLPLGAFGLYAFSGRADHDAARVALCERHARHYGEDWWFLSYLGWSHTEAGNVGAGRTVTERSLALKRDNANAAHALAHAYLEQGDGDAGRAFIADWLPGYDRNGILNGHIAWHMALLALDDGDTAAALAIYRERIALAVSQAAPLNLFTDAASLLWRAQLLNGEVSAADWLPIAAYGAAKFPAAGVHFADVHFALVAAATGDHAGLQRRVAALEDRVAAGRLGPGSVVPDICRAVAAFAGGDYARCAAILEAGAADLVRIGGSNAQREFVEDTLIVACLKAGEPDKAAAHITRRLDRRPSRRDADWLAAAGRHGRG